MQDVISVIVPVYNVARYLPECMESLINQTYKHLEIILIDDGSTDNSGEICDEFANKDSRVIVIHQKNGGAAAAKNAGLRRATGKYLAFADSDDYLECDAYEYMISMLEQYQADVIQCAYRDVYMHEQEERIVSKIVCEYTAEEYLSRYTVDWTCGLLWDKLYVRKLYQDIFFEEGHIIDDEYFTYQGIMNACKIVCTPKVIYNYRKRKSSVTARPEYRQRLITDKLDYLSKRRMAIIEKYPALETCYNEHFLNMLIWLARDTYSTEKSLRQIKAFVREYMVSYKNEKIGIRKRLQLLYIRYVSIARLLKERDTNTNEYNVEKYFE